MVSCHAHETASRAQASALPTLRETFVPESRARRSPACACRALWNWDQLDRNCVRILSLLRADQPWQADATNEAVVEGIKRCEAGIRLHTRPSVVYNDVPFALLFIAGAAPRVLVHIPGSSSCDVSARHEHAELRHARLSRQPHVAQFSLFVLCAMEPITGLAAE